MTAGNRAPWCDKMVARSPTTRLARINNHLGDSLVVWFELIIIRPGSGWELLGLLYTLRYNFTMTAYRSSMAHIAEIGLPARGQKLKICRQIVTYCPKPWNLTTVRYDVMQESPVLVLCIVRQTHVWTVGVIITSTPLRFYYYDGTHSRTAVVSNRCIKFHAIFTVYITPV